MRSGEREGEYRVSNVLIGIIGVILFIGLALAGALILGDDFKTANAASKAAAVSSMMQQVANAATMYQTKRGVTLMADGTDSALNILLAAKSIRSIPVNPTNPGARMAGADAKGGQDGGPVRMFFWDLGDSRNARDVCMAIEETSGNGDAASVVDVSTLFDVRAARQGCMMDKYYADHYVSYIML
jgi:hypothetical protein